MKVVSDERVHSLKVRMAVKLLKAAANILIAHNGHQLRCVTYYQLSV
jgi:hypothetical protein